MLDLRPIHIRQLLRGRLSGIATLENLFLSSDPIFQFTQPVYSTSEDSNPAVVTIELISDSVLTSPVTILVSTVDGGSATG